MSGDWEDTPTGESEERAQPGQEEAQPPEPAAEAAQPPGKRRRRWPRVVLGLLVLVAVGAVLFAAYHFLLRPSPTQIVKSMIATYMGAKTFTADSNIVAEVDMGGAQTKMALPLELAYRAPNLLYFECDHPMVGVKVVCDGQKLYSEYGMYEKVAAAPAPKDLKDLPEEMTAGGLGPEAEKFLDLEALARGEFDPKTVKSIEAGFDRDSEWLADLQKPRGTWAVTVNLAAGPGVVLWVDRRTHLLRQLAAEISADQMPGAGEMPDEVAEGPGAGFAEMFKNMTIRMTLTNSSTSVTQPPPKERFVYKLPKGKELVEAESVADMQRVLMESAMPEPGEIPGMPEAKNLEGQSPPDFTARDLHGKTGKLSSFKGKPLVLDLWSTWCPPCERELDLLEEIRGKLKGQDLQIVAVSTDPTIEMVEKYFNEHPAGFRALWVEPEVSRKVTEDYGLLSIPRTLYIGRDWKVKADTTGLHPKQEILEHIEALGVDTSGAQD